MSPWGLTAPGLHRVCRSGRWPSLSRVRRSPRRRGGRSLDVTTGERQECRPVRAGGVPTAMLTEGEVAVDQAGLDRGELRGSEVLLAEELEHGAGGAHS